MPRTLKITVGEYFLTWINRREHSPLVRRGAVRNYRQDFRKYILPRFEHRRLADLSVSDLKTLRDAILTAGNSVKYARNIIDGSFRAMWRDVLEDELLDKNPFMVLRWPKTRRVAPDPFTAEEKSAILVFVRDDEPFYYPFVFTMFDTGMRPSEATALRRKDVKWGESKLSITKSRYLGAEGDPKTNASWRDVPIAAENLALLAAYCEAIDAVFGEDDSRHLFLNSDGRPLNANKWAQRYWRRFCEGAGVPYRVSYRTRHTFITEMRRSGELDAAIAQHCGNSVVMVDNNYSGRITLKRFENGPKSSDSLVGGTGFEPAGESNDFVKLAVNARFSRRKP